MKRPEVMLVVVAGLAALAFGGPWAGQPVTLLELPAWTLALGENVEASLAVDQDRARIEVIRAKPAEPWAVRVTRRTRIESKQPGALRLRVRANPPRRFQVAVIQLGAPYDNLGLNREVDANEQWQALELPFTPTATEPAALIVCAVGGQTGTVEIEGGQLDNLASP